MNIVWKMMMRMKTPQVKPPRQKRLFPPTRGGTGTVWNRMLRWTSDTIILGTSSSYSGAMGAEISVFDNCRHSSWRGEHRCTELCSKWVESSGVTITIDKHFEIHSTGRRRIMVTDSIIYVPRSLGDCARLELSTREP